MRFTGLVNTADGRTRVDEILPPRDLSTWGESYELLQTAFLGFRTVEIGKLTANRRKLG